MTDVQWETLGNQALFAAGAVYFLALLAHLVEWSGRRGGVVVEQPHPTHLAAGAGGREDVVGEHSQRTMLMGRLGLVLTVFGALIHLVALVGRGMAADPNRVPWGTMYEFSISGAWFVIVIYLLTYKRFKLSWLAPLVVGFVISVMMMAVIWLHQPVTPLTEALESPWLVIHVVSAVIATAAFSLGGMLLILFLVKQRAEKKAAAAGTELTKGYLAQVPDTKTLDRLAYRMHAFGFPVWTFAVLITGPIWAHEAWSRYWNWDPKEVWAFITWVVYAAYLHARTTAGLRGKVAAILALIGLATLWWSFIGVNFLSSTSQHSYA